MGDLVTLNKTGDMAMNEAVVGFVENITMMYVVIRNFQMKQAGTILGHVPKEKAWKWGVLSFEGHFRESRLRLGRSGSATRPSTSW